MTASTKPTRMKTKSVKSRSLAELRKLAEAENAEAQFWLAAKLSQKAFKSENADGVDAKESLAWNLKAAKQGHGGAAHNLGFAYERGFGCSVNAAKSVEWYMKAHERGDVGSILQAVDVLLSGEIMKPNAKVALMLLHEATAKGHAFCHYQIGKIHEEGSGVKKDPKKAAEAYTKGAILGHTLSVIKMGDRFLRGEGVAKDESAGLEMLLSACERKHPDAYFAVAEHMAGTPGKVAQEEAQQFYLLAIQAEHPEAEERLAALLAKKPRPKTAKPKGK